MIVLVYDHASSNAFIIGKYTPLLKHGVTKQHLLPTNANLGRIMRIMETNISLLELLFALNNQIIDINI